MGVWVSADSSVSPTLPYVVSPSEPQDGKASWGVILCGSKCPPSLVSTYITCHFMFEKLCNTPAINAFVTTSPLITAAPALQLGTP